MAIEYLRGESLLHKLDARTKLLLFVGVTITAMIIVEPIIMGLLFLALYWFGTKAIDRKLLNRNLRVLIVIFLTFSLFQVLFFTPKDSYFLFYLIPNTNYIPVTVEGIVRGVAVFFRFFSVVLAVHLMLYTTPPVELALTITERGQKRQVWSKISMTLILGIIIYVASLPMVMSHDSQMLPFAPLFRYLFLITTSLFLAWLLQELAARGMPAEMGVALTLGLATVGILSKQAQQITNAQKARGYDVQPKNLIRRVQVLTALLIPIFLATLERSQDISIAILSRGFDYNISARTYRHEFTFKKRDYLIIAGILVLILGGLALKNLGMSNPTEQFILKLLN
ncbi:MAG TPA: energy-coupling factor transporter transmembrane protein EcfT [Anaerolineae bacterium]|nr:energy-coupling factor transporter transmembrane protein EcfT [Anaerolineae bacterium]